MALFRGGSARRRACVVRDTRAEISGPDWPGDETAETQALNLPAAERQILAALSVVGNGSLSADELADLSDGEDVIPLLEDLEQRGLVRRDERRRYAVPRAVGEQMRQTDPAFAAGDRLLRRFTTLARDGALTPARVAEDAEAIVALSEWAQQTGRLAQLLELVRALQGTFGNAQRAGQWTALLERGRAAARMLGDRASEIWVLQQLASAAAGAGDAVTAQRYLREADELQYGPPQTVTRQVTEETAVAPLPPPPPPSGPSKTLLWILGVIAAAAAGVGLGFVLDSGGSAQTTTVPTTITSPGTTVTTAETTTLPATTVLSTTTETTTTVATTTVTAVP